MRGRLENQATMLIALTPVELVPRAHIVILCLSAGFDYW
jgi:hypothetical protein